MTRKEATLEIIELNITIQTQIEIIEKLTRTAARLNFELMQLPGGKDVINRINAETRAEDDDDDDDDSDSKATVLQLVKNDDDSDSDSDD